MPTEVAFQASLCDLVLDHGENLVVAIPGLVSQQRKEARDMLVLTRAEGHCFLKVDFSIYVAVCFCLGVCVCSLLRYRLNVFLPPLPRV